MANVGVSAIKLIDSDGDALDDGAGKLNVNATLVAGATIDIGDVDMFLDGGTAILGGAGDVAAGVLRVTIADNDPHWGTVGTAADVDGTAHGQLRFIGNTVNTNSGHLTNIASHTSNAHTVLSFAASTTGGQYTEGDGGFLATGVRNDTLASLVSVDHDHAPFQVNAAGALYVDIADGGQLDALLDTIKVDTEAIETAVELLDNAISGSEMQVDVVAALPSGSNNIGYVNVATIGAGSNAIGKLAANSGVDIGDVDVTSLPASTNTIEVVGDAAENAAVAGNPVLVGGRYDSSARTLGDGDVGAIALDDAGYVKIDWTGDVSEAKSVIQSMGDPYVVTNRVIHVAPSVRNDTLTALGNVADGDFSAMQVNAEGALYTTHGMTGMQSDNNEGVDSSTAEVLKSSTACKRVDMQADSANTGYIYVGGSDVSAVKGIRLAPGDFYSIDVDNTADIYVLASVDEEDIHFTYFT